MVEKISALTFRVSNMKVSVQFYRDVLGMELLYGGETAGFSSLRAKYPESAILNLEEGNTVTQWGRLIFYVADVDEVWRHLKERGFDPPQPQNASWGERYFHILDPDGHELSFACRLGQRHEHGEPPHTRFHLPRGRLRHSSGWAKDFRYRGARSPPQQTCRAPLTGDRTIWLAWELADFIS